MLDGKHVSQKIKEGLKKQVDELLIKGQRPPHLAAVLVGNNGASETYVANKVKSCKDVGFQSTLIRLEDNTTEADLIAVVQKLNADDNIDGILVQLPLPAHIDEYKIIEAINPNKDVDGFHPVNTGKMLLSDDEAFLPATPFGILLLLEHYNITTTGKRVVVLGRSNIVGRPISILMGQQRTCGNATVTMCHSQSTNTEEITLQADILISAIGKPESITASMVKEGAVVIDVGIVRVKDETSAAGYKIKGDVHFETVAPKCSYITPVPGGVGPMTIAALMTNTMKAHKQHFI